MANFKIIKGAIIGKDHNHYTTGTIVDTDKVLNEKHIPELLRDGKILQVDGPVIAPLPAIQKKIIVVSADGKVIEAPPTLTSLWTLNAADLTGKTVEELNAMILERDPKATPCADVNEAIAWLTQDAE